MSWTKRAIEALQAGESGFQGAGGWVEFTPEDRAQWGPSDDFPAIEDVPEPVEFCALDICDGQADGFTEAA